MSRRRFAWAWTGWLVLAVAAADLIAFRSGIFRHEPWIIGLLAVSASIFFLARLLQLITQMATDHHRRWSRATEALALAGVLLALGAGTTNWMMRLQGYVVLQEGDVVPLADSNHLAKLDAGPFSSRDELELLVGLEEVELVTRPDGSFHPTSLLQIYRQGEKPRKINVSTFASARVGSLRLFQGAFGYSPRLVLERDGVLVFDEIHILETLREGERLSFTGRREADDDCPELKISIDLSVLDERMRGHPELRLELRDSGELLSAGQIRLGHSVALDGGLSITFAGLQSWSEIDLQRRNYRSWVLAGLSLVLVGALARLVAWKLEK